MPASTDSDWLVDHNGVLSRFRLTSIDNGNFEAPRFCGQLLDGIDQTKETRCKKLLEPINFDDFENLPPRRVTVRLQGFQARRDSTRMNKLVFKNIARFDFNSALVSATESKVSANGTHRTGRTMLSGRFSRS